MKEGAPQYDAAVLHVYGYKERKENEHVRPAFYSRLVLAAARELRKAGQVENFTLSGKQFLGEKEPVSTITANEFVRKAKDDSQNVYVNPSAPVTTNQELKFLRKEAEKPAHNWSHVVSIGWELHKPTIKTLADRIFSGRTFLWFKREKIDIDFKSAEEILQTYPSPRNQERYKRIIDELHQSEGEKKWKKYEERKAKILNLPFVPEILDVVARFRRPKAD